MQGSTFLQAAPRRPMRSILVALWQILFFFFYAIHLQVGPGGSLGILPTVGTTSPFAGESVPMLPNVFAD